MTKSELFGFFVTSVVISAALLAESVFKKHIFNVSDSFYLVINNI